MAKRLSEKQKKEIVESFKSGTAINDLSQKHNCTHATITRNLKKSLGEFEYKELLNKSKKLKEKSKIYKKQNNALKEINFDNEEFKNGSDEPYALNENISVSNFAPTDSFFEIAPIDYEIDNSSRKELSSVPLSEVDFPRVVYMVVDKKIELEIKLLNLAIFNSCLFVLLFIGILNSSNKSKVDFLINETIELPISFLVGSSFIVGSILGSFIAINMNNE